VRLEQIAAKEGGAKIAVMLSPFMSCEEAWLLVRFVRGIAPESTLVIGPIPTEGQDQKFPVGATDGKVKFTILAEKCPNRRGVELIVERAGGAVLSLSDFIAKTKAGAFSAAWIVGGYPKPWVTKELGTVAGQIAFIIAQDMFENVFTQGATLILPACSFAEREGSFMNHAGKIQPFARAINPPEGAKRDNQYLYDIAGHAGLFSAQKVRELMAREIPEFATIHEAPLAPEHAH
jgi:NADH-quinone oxidoreductase subunit G